ncbi:hypothetical protein PR202_ga14345 [Eleusine coracana subsp. coracana]|uniref:Phytocyanin domain-containing protein n=1 Tax=Eleusine coracana subsp. coracana TaxID=191504 RepID=A0AAV5CH51_ELECO|nr:hypothetical protein PR202_ga14345 [Eleusine coracana subsp. coracana]
MAGCGWLLLLLCGAAGAVEHVVGDGDSGWDSGVNYAAWARKRTFAVGDVLVFQYVSSQHNVYEVSESTYRSCDGNHKGVLAKYTSGLDKVVLGEARSYWFICEFPGHCLGGMKLAVNVSAPSSPHAAPFPPGSPSASTAASSTRSRAWSLTMVPLTLALLQFINRAIR